MSTLPSGLPITLRFDRLLAPSTVQRATVSLRTGALGVFCGVTYDPVARVVVVQPNPAEMRPGLQYVLRVEPGLLGWDGSALAAPFTVRFVAGPRVSPPSPEPVPSLARDIAPRLAARCGDARCHGGVAPVMGLDLSSASALRATTLRVLARQRPEGPWVQSAPRWGALPRIDPGVAEGQGRPAMSYLLYKILGDGPIAGARMPPEGDALTDDETTQIARWIAAGAPDN